MDLLGQWPSVRYDETRRKRRVLFVVSRERPERYDSLAQAFSDDDEVQVIFDRRHADRRRQQAPIAGTDRRRRDRRSAARAWAIRAMGWVQVSMTDASTTRRVLGERALRSS
jgi:hypothetical protein